MAEGDKPQKPAAPKEATVPGKSKEAGATVKSKKAARGKKEEAKKVGYAANIEAGLEAKPARLKIRFRTEAVPGMMKSFGYKNPNQVPRLEKIVLNMGLGEAIQNAKILDAAVAELSAITGQRPVVTKAKRAIANFKLRKGLAIGCMVTLRGDRMYEFLDRLVNVALPRVRDFKGVSDKSFDGRGNYSLGIREEIIFPEVDIDKVEKVKGLTVNICTTAKSDDEGRALLKALGVPFRAA